MSPLCTLLSIIESGEPGHFDSTRSTIMLPQPLPERSDRFEPAIVLPAHTFSVTCICSQCEHVWSQS